MNKNNIFVILVIVLLLAIIVSCSILFNTLTEKDEVDPVCKQRAMGLIGDNLLLKAITSDSTRIRCEYSFPDARVEFERPSSNDQSCNVHWGNLRGENKNWLHGSFVISRTFNEQITDDKGFILGNNKFTFEVIVGDISTYYVNAAEESWDGVEMTVLIDKHIVFSDCKFVN